MGPTSKAALISVDDRPAVLFVEGEQIADRVILYAVNPNRIVVKRGDELLRFPLRRLESTGDAPGPLPAAEADSTEPQVPPPGTEERRLYQSQNRD